MSTITEQQPVNIDAKPWEAVHEAWIALGRQYSVNVLNSAVEDAQSRLSEALTEFGVPQAVIELVDSTMRLEMVLQGIYRNDLSDVDAEFLGCEFPRITRLLDDVKEITQQHAMDRGANS